MPAEEHMLGYKQGLGTLVIACPRCDCESVHSILGQIMARHQISSESPGGKDTARERE